MGDMTKQVDEWVATRNRFVAFLDIMGFRDMVLRNTHESVLETMELFQTAIKVIEEDAQKRLATLEKKPTAGEGMVGGSATMPVFFSDSILLVSQDDSIDSASHLLFSAWWLWKVAICSGIPMKGAIAYGKQTANFDKSLYFGKPLIDAYELQDELLLYGVVLHHTMEEYLIHNNIMRGFEDSSLHRYQAPLRNSMVFHYVMCWFSDDFSKGGSAESVVSRLYGTVSGAPRRYVDNTLEFLQSLAKKEGKAS